MFNIRRERLSLGHGIRYLNILDNIFNPNRNPGRMLFYPEDPQYVVSIVIMEDRNKMKEEDIDIICGDLHTNRLVEEEITKQKDIIFEICKTYPSAYFILDIKNLRVVEPEDFTENLPVKGLNTIFRFDGNTFTNYVDYFCLVNTTGGATEKDLLSWMISYIYSGTVCVTPVYKPSKTAIQFFQAIVSLAVFGGKKIYASSSEIVLNAHMNDIGAFDVEIPGKTDRFNVLLERSKLQSKRNDK